jgi:SAM-dependent methyltransferase
VAENTPAPPDGCCRLCRQPSLEKWFELQRSPRKISRLLTEADLTGDTPVRLAVSRCQSCDLVQAPLLDQGIDYNDYILSWMQIETLRDYRTDLARAFSSRLGPIEAPVLDVGCGSGEFLALLAACGRRPIGIEPSATLVARARQSQFDVIHDSVHPGVFSGVDIGGFTCLQVVEHLTDPVGFLTTLRKALPKDGLGLVEVPSLEKIIDERRFYDFFGDHLNYFTARTLRLCCELAGFEVVDVERTFHGQFLVASVRPAVSICLVPADGHFLESMATLRHWAADQTATGRRIAFWGAGYKSIAAIAELDLTGIACVIDSDPAKSGMFTPVSHLPIRHPDTVDFTAIDAIILVAAAYRDEILRQIRESIGFTGPVVACAERMEWL